VRGFGGGLACGAIATLLIARAIIGTGVEPGAHPPPRWPDWRREYPAAFRGVSATHNLLSLGSFGLGRRLREADVLLTGSSHAEFGLSARDLVTHFRTRGMSVKAYNIGVGWGEGFAFPAALIDRYDLRDKVLVVEMFRMLTPLSAVGARALNDNAGTKLVRIANMWLGFTADRLLDLWLAKVELQAARLTVSRRLDQSVIYRRWAEGDLGEFWAPQFGSIYERWNDRFYLPNPEAGAERVDPESVRRVLDLAMLSQRHLKTFTTYIPSVADSGQGHLDAAVAAGIPVLPIRGDAVQLIDDAHPNALGRTLVTAQIADGLFASGVRIGTAGSPK
jgi:hypothetical protein